MVEPNISPKMEKILVILLILTLFSLVLCMPLESFFTSSDSLKRTVAPGQDAEYGDYFEGDMILNEHQLATLSSNRNGLIKVDYRWPNKTVPYQLNPNHTTAQNEYILLALDVLEAVSCIRFRPRTTENNYVQMGSSDGGCFSSVGYQNRTQVVNLKNFNPGEGCFRLGTIMHEFLHALGFYHMQSAYDRDDYVKIQWEHIQPGLEHNFFKYNSTEVSHFNSTYDYKSVMHYSGLAFSKDGIATIVPLNESFVGVIGQRSVLSTSDIAKLNAMYECDKEEKTKS